MWELGASEVASLASKQHVLSVLHNTPSTCVISVPENLCDNLDCSCGEIKLHAFVNQCQC